MPDYLSIDKQYNMLSLLDLLEARDLHHIHLMHKANVVATAVGRYLIRESDPWPGGFKDVAKLARADRNKPKDPRTLENSEVRPYSWPCILVFVDKWLDQDMFGDGTKGKLSPSEMVSKAIYMPDGRVVPVCVVQASLDDQVPATPEDVTYPENLIGGGYPVVADVQGQRHVASVGCMVTDGHLVYALTNRHVSGEPGETIYSILGGNLVEIGKSSKQQLRRLPFQDVYAGWPGKNVYVNLDVGLIEVKDRNQWTAQIYGIGQMGKLADLSINNISLRLIDCPVKAFGCTSREMHGQIHALFYRYKSVGGFEYVADFLIGPRTKKIKDEYAAKRERQAKTAIAKKEAEKPFSTHPGDSGTVWLLETDEANDRPMPIAVQWGGHVFLGSSSAAGGRSSYALATCLSTVCNLLEVDLVRDWNIGFPEYWGEMGHFTIGAKACDLMTNENLKKLMTQNLSNIGFDDGILRSGKFKHDPKKDVDPLHPAFVPLADVADTVWRKDRGHPEKKPFARPDDENNHFADMDQKGFLEGFEGQTLLEICKDRNNVDVDVWLDFYASFKGKGEGRVNPGALPFRVWQIYDGMVNALRQKSVTRFVCAAGLLAHYVGDSCQPLHVSHLHHGAPEPNDTPKEKTARKALHSVYETVMLNNYRKRGLRGEDDEELGLIDGLNEALKKKKAKADVSSGHEAAVSVVELMRQTIKTLPPERLVEVYPIKPLSQTPSERAAVLWENFKEETIKCIAAGCVRLASLWESAWVDGDGDENIKQSDLKTISPKALQKLYQDEEFLESRKLGEMKELLESE